MRLVLLASLTCLLAACSSDIDDGIVDVAYIGGQSDLYASGVRLDLPAQHLRAARAQGLVQLDAAGNVVPGLAERWIVTDDGRSYIFRIAEYDLAGGKRLTAQAVRDSLEQTRRNLRGTSLGLDFAKVAEIRAMTGRVIEFRLKSPMPGFLQLLAQPEFGIQLGETLTGPMRLERGGKIARLQAMPPEERGLPKQPDWAEDIREVRLSVVSARAATNGFGDGRYDLVLGGTLATLPLANSGPLTRGTIRLDSAIGLFGLDVRRTQGFLSKPENRAALAMAIDRDKLLAAFNIGGWKSTTRIVAPGLPGDDEAVKERWLGLSLEARRAEARARVSRWRAASGQAPQLSIYLPEGPGSDMLFDSLGENFNAIGIGTRRTDKEKSADLVLRDRVARYGAARWFLNQFSCRIAPGQCISAVDVLLDQSIEAKTPAEEASFLAEAETTLTAANLYIPLGAPIRWSLARASLTGFTENPWNIHPLFPLSRAPM